MESKPLISERAMVVLFCIVFGYLGSFVMLWIATGDARVAATVQLEATGAVLLILIVAALIGLGASMGARASQHAAPRQPDVITNEYDVLPQRPQPRLSAPNWVPIDDRTLIRGEQIERTAARVYRQLWPHTAPSRAAISKALPDVRSNSFIQAVQEYLVQRGVAHGGGQGVPVTWVDKETDE